MKIVAYILIVISSIFLILSIFNPAFYFGVSPIIDPGLASSFGSFIGGVLGPLLSIVSILLLLDTIKNQKREIDIGETKTHVYELLKYNRDNVGSFEYAKSSDSVAHSYFGISFFVYAKRQIEEAYERLIDFLPKHDKDILVVIAYQVFYFGVSNESKSILLNSINKIVSQEISNEIITYFRALPTEYNKSILYFGGHQNRLSSYFRQLYCIIKLIDEDKNMSESQKKHLAKIVRVQLGNYEQAILLYNSLCSLGKAWSEIGKDSKCLLERYELIKNLQEGFIQGVDFKKRYPKIEYEET